MEQGEQMSPYFEYIIKVVGLMLLLVIAFALSGCNSALTVLDGASHACGKLYVEGYLTDTQGDVIVVKAPEDWTADQVKAFCSGE